MAKSVSLVLTDEEAGFLAASLERVSIQGVGAARVMASIADKLEASRRFAAERPEKTRGGLDQALLSRVTPLERTGVDPQANGGAR
jgi:hypothetical protein